MKLILTQDAMEAFLHGHLYMLSKTIFAQKKHTLIMQLDNNAINRDVQMNTELKILHILNQEIILS